MIYFLTTRRHDYTIKKCLASSAASLSDCVRPMCYGQLFLTRRFAPGTYVFSDLERLDESSLQKATAVRDALRIATGFRVLNHPGRSLRRFELLDVLAREGINSFGVYRLDDRPRPKRFPVFIRGEDDHKGPLSGLIHSQDELDACGRQWDGRIGGRGRKLVIEFADVSDSDGVFRKYSAFMIGDRVIPRHLFFASHWCVKSWDLLGEAFLQEERDYIATDPHQDQLRRIFGLAGIEFGRIDYGVKQGRIEVWEINTNPMLPVDFGGGGEARQALHDRFTECFVQAMRDIDSSLPAPRVTISRTVPLWKCPTIPAQVLYRRVTRGSRKRLA